MMDQSTYIYGIEAMAKNCPENGNVTVSFLVNSGNIRKTTLTKSEDVFTEGPEKEHNEEAEVFTEALKARIFSDIADKRLQYGTITVSIETERGELKSYSVTTASTLNRNLLASEMKHHENKQKGKAGRAA